MKQVAIAMLLGILTSQTAMQAATIPPPAPIFRSASTTSREVALTFDDGPSTYTPLILSILKRFHVHATFFVVGRLVLPLRATVRAEIDAGDEVGNHTYTHADLEWLSRPEILNELEATNAAIHSVTGGRPRWFRPPYGAVNSTVSSLARTLGLWTITWSVDPQDWKLPGVGWITSDVVTQSRPGCVILLHDGGGNRWQTVAALPNILRTLQKRGFRFVTLDELFFPAGRKLH